MRDQAEMHGYTVVEPGSVIATHLTETVRKHADEILTRDATKHLIDELKQTSPAVVDELIPGVMKLAEVQQILQMLLREQVPIRQLGPILETLGDYAPRTKDPILLTEYVRAPAGPDDLHPLPRRGGPAARGHARPGAGGPHSRRLRAQRARAVHPHVAAGGGDHLPADRRRGGEARDGQPPADRAGQPADPRGAEADDRPHLPQLVVLSYNEITRDTKIESVAMVADDERSRQLNVAATYRARE